MESVRRSCARVKKNIKDHSYASKKKKKERTVQGGGGGGGGLGVLGKTGIEHCNGESVSRDCKGFVKDQ